MYFLSCINLIVQLTVEKYVDITLPFGGSSERFDFVHPLYGYILYIDNNKVFSYVFLLATIDCIDGGSVGNHFIIISYKRYNIKSTHSINTPSVDG